MVSLGETSVYHHQLSVGLDRILSTDHMHRNMPVDDMSIRTCNAKFVHNPLRGLFFFTQRKIEALVFLVGLFLLQEVTLKSCHLGFIEEWAVGSTPKIEEIVDSILMVAFFVIAVGLESRAHHHTDVVQKFLSLESHTGINLYRAQRSV